MMGWGQFHMAGDVREVQWLGSVPRDELSTGAKNSLGSISTIFLVPADIASELEQQGFAYRSDVLIRLVPMSPFLQVMHLPSCRWT